MASGWQPAMAPTARRTSLAPHPRRRPRSGCAWWPRTAPRARSAATGPAAAGSAARRGEEHCPALHAFLGSCKDARRTSITRDELLGLAWHFRHTRRAARIYTWDDPYWVWRDGGRDAGAPPLLAATARFCGDGLLNLRYRGIAGEVARGAEACFEACAANSTCGAWSYGGVCEQIPAGAPVPGSRNTDAIGAASGVKGTWKAGKTSHCATLDRPGTHAAAGDASLCAASEGATATAVSFGSGTTLSDLWKDFSASGKLDGKLNLTEVRELLKLPSAARAKVLKVMSTAQLHAAMSSSNSAPLRNYIRKLLDERRGPGP